MPRLPFRAATLVTSVTLAAAAAVGHLTAQSPAPATPGTTASQPTTPATAPPPTARTAAAKKPAGGATTTPASPAATTAPAAATPAAGSAFESAIASLKFRELGPATMGGRIDDVAVVESDPSVVYVGTASGGVWKTTNAGTTWTPIFDKEEVSTIGDVALAPSDPSIVWVGTGEANNRQSSSWGNGVYRSTDAGATWKHMGLRDTQPSPACSCTRRTRPWSTLPRSAACGGRTRSAASSRPPTAARPGSRCSSWTRTRASRTWRWRPAARTRCWPRPTSAGARCSASRAAARAEASTRRPTAARTGRDWTRGSRGIRRRPARDKPRAAACRPRSPPRSA